MNARPTPHSLPDQPMQVGLTDYGQGAEMLTIDAQVHAYEHNHPGRPWVGTLTGPAEVTGDQMVAAMDAVGVDGAIWFRPSACTATTRATPRKSTRRTPTVRAGEAGRSDRSRSCRHDRRLGHTDGTVGIRVFLRDNASTDPADPAINRVLAVAAQHSLPVNLACTGRLDQAGGLAAAT